MNEYLIRTFHRVADAYRRNLSLFWPTVGDRGFTEQNQVHQFCKEAEKVLPSPVATYLEVPFGGNDRLDGIIVNLTEEHPALILVEAKRIKQSGYTAADDAIKRDVARLKDENRITSLTTRIVNPLYFDKVYIYMAFIADVWVGGTPTSKKVVNQWCDDTSPTCKGWEGGTFIASGPIHADPYNADCYYHLLLGIGPVKYVLNSKGNLQQEDNHRGGMHR